MHLLIFSQSHKIKSVMNPFILITEFSITLQIWCDLPSNTYALIEVRTFHILAYFESWENVKIWYCIISTLGRSGTPRASGVPDLPKGSAGGAGPSQGVTLFGNVLTNFVNVSTLVLNASAKTGFLVQTLGVWWPRFTTHCYYMATWLLHFLLRNVLHWGWHNIRVGLGGAWPSQGVSWGFLIFPRGQMGVPDLPKGSWECLIFPRSNNNLNS